MGDRNCFVSIDTGKINRPHYLISNKSCNSPIYSVVSWTWIPNWINRAHLPIKLCGRCRNLSGWFKRTASSVIQSPGVLRAIANKRIVMCSIHCYQRSSLWICKTYFTYLSSRWFELAGVVPTNPPFWGQVDETSNPLRWNIIDANISVSTRRSILVTRGRYTKQLSVRSDSPGFMNKSNHSGFNQVISIYTRSTYLPSSSNKQYMFYCF